MQDSARFNSLQRISKIGILAESELFRTYDFSKKLSENFGVPKDNFDIVLYNNEYGPNSMDEHQSFTEKDFGMFGKVKSDRIKKIVNSKYDLLVDYCANDNVFAKVICNRSKSKLIAGFENNEFQLYDISIKLEGNKIDTFNEELTKYLQILNLLG